MKLKEKIMNASIDTRQFYIMGIICFLVVALASIYTGIVTWQLMDLGSQVSTIFRVVFNFGIVLFFNFLLNSLPPREQKETEINIDEIIEKSSL